MIGKLLTGEQTPCEMNPLNYLRVPNYELGTLGGISKEIGVPSDPLFWGVIPYPRHILGIL